VLGYIHSIETLGAVDGPGIRTVVFLQGCPMQCIYCHNPDTWDIDGGKAMDTDDIIKKIKRYVPYYKTGGGVTLSGGEPLMQADFTAELLEKCKAIGVNTALDTSGAVFNEGVKKLLSYVDLVILDVKHWNEHTFEKITQYKMDNFNEFLDYCRQIQKPLIIRQVIVKGINENDGDVKKLCNLVEGCNVTKIELLPFHNHGAYKWKELGLEYALSSDCEPSKKEMDKLNKCLDFTS